MKGHSRSKVMTHINKVSHLEHFCYRPLRPTGNGLTSVGDFLFRYLEMTPRGHPRWRSCGFWTYGVYFPIVFHGNHRSISHRLVTIHLFQTTDDRQTTLWQYRLVAWSNELTKMFTIAHLVQTRTWGTFLSIGTNRLRASVYPALQANFNFRDLEGHPRSRSLRILNPWYQVPISIPK